MLTIEAAWEGSVCPTGIRPLPRNLQASQPVGDGSRVVDMLLEWPGGRVAVEVDGPSHFLEDYAHGRSRRRRSEARSRGSCALPACLWTREAVWWQPLRVLVQSSVDGACTDGQDVINTRCSHHDVGLLHAKVEVLCVRAL
jgi:hypothetical protein